MGTTGDPLSVRPTDSIEAVLWAHRETAPLLDMGTLRARVAAFEGRPMGDIPRDLRYACARRSMSESDQSRVIDNLTRITAMPGRGSPTYY